MEILPKTRIQVSLRQLENKQILGQAGLHSLITDRKIEDGGQELGFTSSELLLLAIGSCALANIRKCACEHAINIMPIELAVQYKENPNGARDLIEIILILRKDLGLAEFELIAKAARSGGVTGRLNELSGLVVSKIIK